MSVVAAKFAQPLDTIGPCERLLIAAAPRLYPHVTRLAIGECPHRVTWHHVGNELHEVAGIMAGALDASVPAWRQWAIACDDTTNPGWLTDKGQVGVRIMLETPGEIHHLVATLEHLSPWTLGIAIRA